MKKHEQGNYPLHGTWQAWEVALRRGLPPSRASGFLLGAFDILFSVAALPASCLADSDWLLLNSGTWVTFLLLLSLTRRMIWTSRAASTSRSSRWPTYIHSPTGPKASPPFGKSASPTLPEAPAALSPEGVAALEYREKLLPKLPA